MQDFAADALCWLGDLLIDQTKTLLGVEKLVGLVEAQAAGRNFTDAAPFARHDSEDFPNELLSRVVTLGPDGSAPIGIDEALAALRRSRLVELGFPVIRLTDVHWRKLGTSETTGFSIAALPKTRKSGTGN